MNMSILRFIPVRICDSGALRNRLKAFGWWCDPVAAVRRLPDDPGQWEAAEALLAELDLTGPKSSQNRP